MQKLIYPLSVTMLLSCQTFNKSTEVDPKNIPIFVQNFFKSCDQIDGGGLVSMHEDSSMFNSLNYDWISKNHLLHFQGANTIGTTLLDIQVTKKNIKVEGLLKDKIPKLEIEENFIVVDEHKIGIKYNELACLLNFSLPKSWVNKISKFHSDGNTGEIELATEWRDIKIKYSDPNNVCTTIEWSYYWGLSSHEITLCNSLGKKKSAVLTGLDNLKLKWVSDE